jgi:hypothetical protein
MKKVINKILFGGLVAGMALTSVSCADDYLDTKPTDATSTADAVGTVESAYGALNGIAKLMTVQHANYSGFSGENHIMIKMESYPAQNYNYNYYASGWAPLLNQEYNFRNNTIYDSYAWYYYYSVIGGANTIIANIDAASGPEADKKFIKASALTFRAFAYEKLTRYYCNRWADSNNGAGQGLVLRLDESTGDLPYSTLLQTLDRIYTDCQDAITLFEESKVDRNPAEVWIANKNVAHAVYARAALIREDWQTALDQAKLARVGFPLMSNDEYKAGFCNPTKEWIFGSFGGSEEQNWYWSYGTQYSCNGDYATADPTGAGGIDRFLINRIPNEDVRKSLFITEDKFPGYDYTDPNVLNPTYAILGMGNDDIWEDVDAYVESMTPSGLSRAYASGYFYLGGQLKFWVFDMPGVSYLPFIRSSEMVLIEAEANYNLPGGEAAAQAALVELNATSGRNPNYTCTKTGADLFEEIHDYRSLELWGEGFDWSDYKRWNRPVSRKTVAQGGNHHPSVAIDIATDAGNKWTWAVPEREILYNDALNVAPEAPEE